MKENRQRQIKTAGSASLSGLVILCVLAMVTFYIYEIYLSETNSLMIYKRGIIAKNIVIGRAIFLADAYASDRYKWEKDCKLAEKAYDFRYAPLVDEYTDTESEDGNTAVWAYLMRQGDEVYVLDVQSDLWQVRLHLKEEGGEVVVQRWER